jgi:pimeloyl-ACP methyl ester carboxylesterase
MTHLESQTEIINVRGLRYNIRHWGSTGAPTLFFLHGWMDSSPTFQFVVDALKYEWHVIAPDWRGYGSSEWLSRPYWFPDYYADLECILQHFSQEQPAKIVGHSMGANIAATYAGIRPERVSQLVMLDFIGLKQEKEINAPAVLGLWLNEIQAEPKLRSYLDHVSLANRLMTANARLNPTKAALLSHSVSRVRADDSIEMACDPWHKIPSPVPYRVEDAKVCWRKIQAPVLLVVADQGYVNQRFGNDPDEFRSRIECFSSVRVATITDSGHNLQHDQPEQVASALEEFLQRD